MIRELYQEVILDHNRRPRNKGVVEGGAYAHGHNPLCGDDVTISLLVSDALISNVAFEGRGCAISTASASMLTEAVMGKPVDEAKEIAEAFVAMITTGEAPQGLGELEALAGVHEFPSRVKCATLAWHTLEEALLKS